MMLKMTESEPPRELASAIRVSLEVKIERLLGRPLIARIEESRLDDSGAWIARIAIDYDERWRGREREVHDLVSRAVEETVTFLTDAQRDLLAKSPRELLELRPEGAAELVAFETERGTQRIIEITLGAAPESPHVRYLAIVPNLVQLERQIDALNRVESADDDGPLAPLRALLGLCDPSRLATRPITEVEQLAGELDEHQRRCVGMALSTPHFAVIEGPPGSGKTTVITSIVQRALARGERVLAVSPTHVAVDNVVERLVRMAPDEKDVLAPHTLPVRYATRTTARFPQRPSGYCLRLASTDGLTTHMASSRLGSLGERSEGWARRVSFQ